MRSYPWQRPFGALPVGDGTIEFRTWAPRAESAAVRVGGADHPLADEGHGVKSARVAADANSDYQYVLDGEALPDPLSRFQPEGLRGPSRVVDPGAFAWTDERWTGLDPHDLVIYELHVGTFSPEGTFDGAIPHLRALRELGVTAIELMPVADFPGTRGWGYDGVYLAAPHRAYGGPDGLRRLVDAAHAEGLGVVMDLVLNHVGASGGKALEAFGPYFTEAYSTFWGAAINYDDAESDPVREWAIQSAEVYVREYHCDGLRLDAIHSVFDLSAKHVLADLAERIHALGGIVIAESGLNDAKVIRPPEVGGWGHDAQWADDFHHALRVLLTGDNDGYYEDFGKVADLAKAFKRPFVHDGTWSDFRRRTFGAPADDRAPHQFVVFTQDHDQVGNRALGDRLPAAAQRLAAFCVLLSPFTPMLWMGEEYGEAAPFQFFTDHIDPDIAEATRDGRRREFASFAAFAGEDVPDPQDPGTFARSKLTREEEPGIRDLYTQLLARRRELGHTEVDAVEYDESARWLVVRRGEHTLACNFAEEGQVVPAGGDLLLATHEATAGYGGVRLPARAGALLR